MNMHKNARLTPKARELLIARLERGEHPGDVACAMSIPDPARQKPMERQSASSSLLCANGPTGAPIKPQSSERPNCPAGCIITIGTARTPAYNENHPSADQGWI